MYEITHKGWWFRWSALDAPSRWLMAGFTLAVVLAMLSMTSLAAILTGAPGFYFGRLGRSLPGFTPELAAWQAWWILGCTIASCVFWWRLSVRQDELFNRIQNWSFGMAGAWTVAIFGALGILSAASITRPEEPWGVIALFCLLFTGFWLYAVRRWAS